MVARWSSELTRWSPGGVQSLDVGRQVEFRAYDLVCLSFTWGGFVVHYKTYKCITGIIEACRAVYMGLEGEKGRANADKRE